MLEEKTKKDNANEQFYKQKYEQLQKKHFKLEATRTNQPAIQPPRNKQSLSQKMIAETEAETREKELLAVIEKLE